MFHRRFKHFLVLGLSVFIASTAFAVVPSGYYHFAGNKKQAALKTALHTYGAPMTELDYGGGAGFTWEGFYSTDNRNDTVVDMYSNIIRKFSGFSAVTGMNIEHSFPKSWWGGANVKAYRDLFHLYPADDITNITKSNLPLGEVTGTPSLDNGVTKIGINGFETVYADKCFEPADEYKGDFARSYFYVSTIYEELAPIIQSPMVINGSTYPFWKPWAIDLLLKWSREDPVSSKELKRNESIYNIQGNRNPFIDYPDLAEYIWGVDTTRVYPFPAETNPFLIAPRHGVTIDFGVLFLNDSKSQTLHLQGVNINSDIQLSLSRNSSAIQVLNPVITQANALNGTDINLTFHPIVSGLINDTLVIQGGGLSSVLRIPVKALASSDFITLEPTDVTPVGGTLQWISDPTATDYHLKVYQGEQAAGDLIISTYVEGSGWNKALEIYNGTGKTVNLSNYKILKQSNGAGNFGYPISLSGTLDNNKTFVLINGQCSIADMRAKANAINDSINFNGDDAVALSRNGLIIDVVGVPDLGPSVNWGMDVTLQRKSAVTHPVSVYRPEDWQTYPVDTYSMLGSHQMTFNPGTPNVITDMMTGKQNSYIVQGLSPLSNYTYSVEAAMPGGNSPAINTMQLHTSELEIPVMMDASDISSNGFTANWEETLYATGYKLNVFTVSGQADTTEVEGFDNIGSAGVPILPAGWSGTASGIYLTGTSSGASIPSVDLKTNKEWLQTKSYPQPVTKFTYMYRFGSTSTGSSIVVNGLSNNNWVRIDSILYKNTTKAYPVYNFTKEQNMTVFKFTFNKPASGGNLGIDDASATYGNQDSIFIVKDKPVSTNFSVFTNLSQNTKYYYKVKATLGSSVSASSETIGAVTLMNSKIPEQNTSSIKIISKTDKVSISGLQGGELIQVYSLTGICMYQTKAVSQQHDIPMHQNGIFLIRIQDRLSNSTFKIIR